jgi:hypothetical protein
LALAAVACVLSAWSAGPAHANDPLAGVAASVTAVQQATAPVVRTIESSPVRTAASPGRPAARVHTARAAVADSVENASTHAATAAQPVANHAATVVETASNGAATAVETASKSELPKHATAVVRDASKHAANGVRTAPERAAAVGSAPKRLVVAANMVAKLGAIASTLTLTTARRDGVTGEPTRFGGIVTSAGAAQPATATGHALRRVASTGRQSATATREAPTQPFERAGGELTGFEAPATQPGSPSSGATGVAGAAAMALLGLFAFLTFGSQRPGALVWLRPASSPASPFLALPERPG